MSGAPIFFKIASTHARPMSSAGRRIVSMPMPMSECDRSWNVMIDRSRGTDMPRLAAATISGLAVRRP